uniref:L-Fucosyltransferase n=1 Tax=Panagrellus redivivus TaxID=6233 RepID=A0A7E4UR08_PANRE
MFKNKVRNILILGNLAMISLCIYVWTRSKARDIRYHSVIKSVSGSSSVGYSSPRHRGHVLSQNRTFPRGGDSLTFDQPWQITPIKVFTSFDKLDKNVKYIVSNFTYSPGLGNLMFQFASLRALAVQHKATLILPSNCLLRRAFAPLTLTHNDSGVVFVKATVVDRYLKDHKGITVNDCCRYNANISVFNAEYEKDLPQVAVVNGYFQSYKYFSPEYTGFIKKAFTFLPHVVGAADAILENAKFKNWNNDLKQDEEQGNDIVVQLPEEFSSDYFYVGIHVRHGIDLTMHSRNIKHGHVVAPGDYYSRAMKYFVDKITHKKVIFVVASDDLPWVRKTFVSNVPGQFIFVNSGHREVDLATLTLCNASIISTGTFSWWSGWLNRGTEVVYFKDWPASDSQLAAQVDKDDYFPSSWIAM